MYPRLFSIQDDFSHGMSVYDLFRNQVGTVIATARMHDEHMTMYRVHVQFPDGSTENYTPDGRNYLYDFDSYSPVYSLTPYY